MVWKVNISVRKRLSLMALFSGAAFVIMASIIRAVTIVKVSAVDLNPSYECSL